MLVVLRRNIFLRGNRVTNRATIVAFRKPQHCQETDLFVRSLKYNLMELQDNLPLILVETLVVVKLMIPRILFM